MSELKPIHKVIAGLTILILSVGTYYFTGKDEKVGVAPLTFVSSQVGASPAVDFILSTDGSKSIWIENTGGGTGGGSVGTSSVPVIGQVPFWTTSGDTPELLGTVATTSIIAGTGLSFTGTLGALVGGTDGTLNVSLASFDTDDLSEGSTNLYFTDARARANADWELSAGFLQPTTTQTVLLNNGFVSQASSTFIAETQFKESIFASSTSNLELLMMQEKDRVYTGNVSEDSIITITGSTTFAKGNSTPDCFLFGCPIPEALLYDRVTNMRFSPNVLGSLFLFRAIGTLTNEPTRGIQMGPTFTLADGTKITANTSNITQPLAFNVFVRPEYLGINGGKVTVGAVGFANYSSGVIASTSAEIVYGGGYSSQDPIVVGTLSNYIYYNAIGTNVASSTINFSSGIALNGHPGADFTFFDIDEDPWKFTGAKIEDVASSTVSRTATLNESRIFMECAGACTLTLPDITEDIYVGLEYVIKNGGGGALTIDGNGSDTIDGAATQALGIGQSTTTTSYTLTQWFTH